METTDPRLPRARAEGLVIQELPDELLVYDLERHRAHSLNGAATLVWRHCDGQTTFSEMAAHLHRELSLPQDEEVVRLALDRLRRARLLQGRATPPSEHARASRRAVVRRLGLVGGLAVLLPLVESIVAPTPAHAASCVPDQPGCLPKNDNCTTNSQCCTCNCQASSGKCKD